MASVLDDKNTDQYSSGSIVKKFFKSLLSTENVENRPEEEKFLVGLTEQAENHGWCQSKGAAHFSFCKAYKFDSRKDASDFLVIAVCDKNSNHIHLEVNAVKPVILDVNVYSDDNDHNNKCLEMCLELDERFSKQFSK